MLGSESFARPPESLQLRFPGNSVFPGIGVPLRRRRICWGDELPEASGPFCADDLEPHDPIELTSAREIHAFVRAAYYEDDMLACPL